MSTFKKLERNLPQIKPKTNVAAYARVSMDSERLLHSFSAQVSHYSELIQKNPEWNYAGVYADEGRTGTKVEARPEFKRMLEDCEAGKIDLILTKSISRFARNTVDLLQTVRHLKELDVEVRFEEQQISTFSNDGELMLTILASFAQEEVRNLSDNVKWGTRKRFEKGIPNGKFRIYGYRWENNELVVVPEEAAIVRRIFSNFLAGKSRLETEREFASEGITTRDGCRWVDSNIKVVLTNITYTGNMLFQKEFIEDPITKHRKKNRGELPQYYVEDTHEAIIDKETFDYVQSEIARRKDLGALANKSLNISCFTGKIKCEHCGVSYMHNYRTDRGNPQEFWTCGTKKKKGSTCPVKGSVPQKIIEQECAAVLGLETFDEDVFRDKVSWISVPAYRVLVFHLNDGSEVTRHWKSTAKHDCWDDAYKDRQREWVKNYMAGGGDRFSAFTTRIKCGCCGQSCRRATQKTKDGKVNYWRCASAAKCGIKGIREDELKEISAGMLGANTFDEDVFREKVECITVQPGSVLEFAFTDGSNATAEYTRKRRSHKWTEEQRAKFMESSKNAYTPERRKAMSENMKRIRKEKYWSSTGKKRNTDESNS